MTYERSYTDCIRPVLGRSGPLQAFDKRILLDLPDSRASFCGSTEGWARELIQTA